MDLRGRTNAQIFALVAIDGVATVIGKAYVGTQVDLRVNLGGTAVLYDIVPKYGNIPHFGFFIRRKLMQNHVKKLVFTSLFTALIIVCTAYVSIPLPLVGYVHLGDAFIFLSTFILGPIYGAVAAGIGSALADLIVYPAYALATLIVKALMSLTAYALYYLLSNHQILSAPNLSRSDF